MLSANQKVIENLKAHPEITDVELHNYMTMEEGKLLAEALQGRHLTSLRLAGTLLKTPYFMLLVPIINNSPQLRTLNLQGIHVDWSALTLTCVEQANFENCSITDKNSDAFNEFLKRNPNLYYLNMNQNRPDVNVMKTLHGRKWNKLVLKNCSLRWDACKPFIKQILENPDSVDVSDNRFSNQLMQMEITNAQILAALTQKVTIVDSEKIKGLEEKIKNMERVHKTEKFQLTNMIKLLETQVKEIADKFENMEKRLNELEYELEYIVKNRIQVKGSNNAKIQESVEQQKERISRLENKLMEGQRTETKDESVNTRIQELEQELKQTQSKIKSASQFINELLFEATRSGNYDMARTALVFGPDLKAIDPLTGETCLMLALNNDHKEIAELFSNKDSQVITYPDQQGRSPLEKAVEDNDVRRTYWLWEQFKNQNPDIDLQYMEYQKYYKLASDKNQHFLTKDLLNSAVKAGNLNYIKKILDLNNIKSSKMMNKDKNETWLYEAVYYKHPVELARFLIAKGADYHAKSYERPIPADATEEKINECQKKPESAYELAFNMKNMDMIVLFAAHELFKCIDKHTYAHLVRTLQHAQSHLQDSFKQLFMEKDFNHQTILHLAATCDAPQFMAHLLDDLPDVALLDTPNAEGKTPLHLAIEKNCRKIVNLLLKKGASIIAKDEDGQIPLHTAVNLLQKSEDEAKAMEIIYDLFFEHAQRKISPYIEDKHGRTPMEIATNIGGREMGTKVSEMYTTARVKKSKLKHSMFLPSDVSQASPSDNSAELQKKNDGPESPTFNTTPSGP